MSNECKHKRIIREWQGDDRKYWSIVFCIDCDELWIENDDFLELIDDPTDGAIKGR